MISHELSNMSYLNHINIAYIVCVRGMVMVLNATFNNISVISLQSVLSVVETGVPGKNHLPATGTGM